MIKKLFAGLLAFLFSAGTAAAQNCNANPFTLTNGQPADATQVMANFNNALACAALLQVRMPGGRLTLATGTPVMISDVAGATTVFYTPYQGRLVPIWNGTTFAMTDTGGELSQATTDTTKSPSAVAANSVYDVFVWNDGGTIRATRGPAWVSNTSRGTGLGTTQLQLLNGIYTNQNAITNGPGANLGTYVGTISSNGSATIDWKLGTLAAGTQESRLCVWNMYNRVAVGPAVADNTLGWTYATGTWRPSDNSTQNRISAVFGMNEDASAIRFQTRVTVGAGFSAIGVGLDSTTAPSAQPQGVYNLINVVADFSGAAQWGGLAGLGFHYWQALEIGDGTHANTFNGSTYFSLQGTLRM